MVTHQSGSADKGCADLQQSAGAMGATAQMLGGVQDASERLKEGEQDQLGHKHQRK